MRRLLFLDRDGTILVEPEVTKQVDEIDQFEFLPDVISTLKRIVNELEFELVLITNQDGLGTESFPRETFELLQSLMLRILQGEGIKFKDILIDESFESMGLSTRKPGLGLVQPYLSGDFDIANSYVVGDRESDIILANKMGCRSIKLGEKSSFQSAFNADNWKQIFELLKGSDRAISVSRKTNETSIEIDLNLDADVPVMLSTALPFFDHMLEQIARHGKFALSIQAVGDLDVDEHHLVEDCGIALGQALRSAIGKKKCIDRYGFELPMDESLAHVALDLAGRSAFCWQVSLSANTVGGINTHMFKHFFSALASELKCGLHISAKGENDHHIVEGIFKAFGRCLRQAINRGSSGIPSSKGKL